MQHKTQRDDDNNFLLKKEYQTKQNVYDAFLIACHQIMFIMLVFFRSLYLDISFYIGSKHIKMIVITRKTY